jgi:hypothetical protein
LGDASRRKKVSCIRLSWGCRALADRSDVVIAEVAVLDGGGRVREFGRQDRSGQTAARPNAGNDAHPAPDSPG